MFQNSQKMELFSQRVLNINFAQHLRLTVTDVQPDTLTMQMPLIAEEHGNSAGVVHGGVIMSIADTAMGFACANLGRTVTTMDFNINFLKSVQPEGCLKAVANIIHNGKQTMVAEAQIYNSQNQLVAKTRGTFFITGKIDN